MAARIPNAQSHRSRTTPSPVLANIIKSCSHKSKLKFVNPEANSDSNYIAERTIQYAITSVNIACAHNWNYKKSLKKHTIIISLLAVQTLNKIKLIWRPNMNNEWRSEKSQDMKKITTITMNKKMSVVTTLYNYVSPVYRSLCRFLPGTTLHAILEQNIEIHNSHYCCAHILHTPLHSHACTHLSSYTHVHTCTH